MKAPRRSRRAASNARPVPAATSAVQGGGAAVRLARQRRELFLVVGDAEEMVWARVLGIEPGRGLERVDRLVHGVLAVVGDAELVVEPRVVGMVLDALAQRSHRAPVLPHPDVEERERVETLD